MSTHIKRNTSTKHRIIILAIFFLIILFDIVTVFITKSNNSVIKRIK